MEECITGQAGLVAVRESMPLRPGRAGSSLVVRLVLLALKTKEGLRLRRTSLATVLAPLRSAKRGKGMGSSEKQNPFVRVPHTLYVGIGGFMRATACFIDQ